MSAPCDCGITEPHVHPPYLGLVGMLMGYQGAPILQSEERARLLGVIATMRRRDAEAMSEQKKTLYEVRAEFLRAYPDVDALDAREVEEAAIGHATWEEFQEAMDVPRDVALRPLFEAAREVHMARKEWLAKVIRWATRDLADEMAEHWAVVA